MSSTSSNPVRFVVPAVANTGEHVCRSGSFEHGRTRPIANIISVQEPSVCRMLSGTNSTSAAAPTTIWAGGDRR